MKTSSSDEPVNTESRSQVETPLLPWIFRKWTDWLLVFAALHLITYLAAPWLRDERISYAAFFLYSVTLFIWRCKARALLT